MKIFFILQLISFFFSVILFNHWVNLLITQRRLFEYKYLPCFTWGWFIYFAIYKIGRWTSASVESVHMIYTSMALIIPVIAGICWFFNRNRSMWQERCQDLPVDRWTLLIVAAFIGGMIIVRPYLEFPSDPVEHLYRIQAWEKVRWMDYNGYPLAYSRFVYFFEHWLLQPSDLSLGDRTGLSILSPILQGMLFWQFIRITKLLTNSTVLGWFGGLLSLGYFGYSAISFYRYTVLAGALLAFICCLEGFILIISTFLREEWRYLFLLPPILVFCWGNHEQETLLQLNAIAGICVNLLIFRYQSIGQNFRKTMLILTVGAIVSILLICSNRAVLSVNKLPENISFHLEIISNFLGVEMMYHKFAQLNEMIGIVGWLAMISALLVLFFNHPSKKLDIMASLCIWPIICLWNPLSIEIFMRFINIGVLHRLIYTSLYWIFPIILLQELSTKNWDHNILYNTNDAFLLNNKQDLTKQKIFFSVIISLVLLSWIPVHPIRGKMRHVWLKLEPRLDGSNLKPTIEYLREFAPQTCVEPYPDQDLLPIRSFILSDPYVNTYLSGTGHFYTVTHRWDFAKFGSESPPIGLSVSNAENIDYTTFLERINKNQICYVILYMQTQELSSLIGGLVGHWSIDYAKTQRYYSADFIEWITKNPQDFELVFTDDAVRVFKIL